VKQRLNFGFHDGQATFSPTPWRAFWSGFKPLALFAVSGVD